MKVKIFSNVMTFLTSKSSKAKLKAPMIITSVKWNTDIYFAF